MHFLFNLILVVEKVITHHHRLQTNCSLDYLAASEAFSLMREWRGLYLKNVETNYPPSMLTLTQQWPRCVWRCDTGKFELHSNSLFYTQDNRSSCVKSENRVQHNERHEQLLVSHPLSMMALCSAFQCGYSKQLQTLLPSDVVLWPGFLKACRDLYNSCMHTQFSNDR